MFYLEASPTLLMLAKYVLVLFTCGLAALMSHLCIAVFHDGVRPILPELVEGRMSRKELGSVAFGLSIGFIASIGFSFTVPTGIFNPWLLFLTTDVIGIFAPKKVIAVLGGVAWGLACVFGFGALHSLLNALPVNFFDALTALSSPVTPIFTLFPLVAIGYQFNWKKAGFAAVAAILFRIIINRFTGFSADSMTMLAGMIMLIFFSIQHDWKMKKQNPDYAREFSEEDDNLFEKNTSRYKKNMLWIIALGCLIAVMNNIGVFAGTEASIFTLYDAQQMAATNLSGAKALIYQSALNDFIRGIGFLPLQITTALMSGAASVKGLSFLYAVSLIAPNPLVTVLLVAPLLVGEVYALRSIGRLFQKFPTLRSASENIRTAITTSLEFALIIGGINAASAMGGGLGLIIGASIYLLNEAFGRPIMRLAIGPVAAIGTGILLNLLYFAGLFVI